MTGKDGWWKRLHLLRDSIPARPRKYVVTAIGTVLLAIGLAMIVLPGPAFLMIPAGLAVLGTEYEWARRLMNRVHRLARKLQARGQKRRRLPHDVVRRGFGVPRSSNR